MVRELKKLLGWCDDDYGVSKFFNEKFKSSDLVNEKIILFSTNMFV